MHGFVDMVPKGFYCIKLCQSCLWQTILCSFDALLAWFHSKRFTVYTCMCFGDYVVLHYIHTWVSLYIVVYMVTMSNIVKSSYITKCSWLYFFTCYTMLLDSVLHVYCLCLSCICKDMLVACLQMYTKLIMSSHWSGNLFQHCQLILKRKWPTNVLPGID